MTSQSHPGSEVVRAVEQHDGHARVVLSGEIDIATVEEVQVVLQRECRARQGSLLVDLTDVEFLDSSALHLFTKTHRQLQSDGCSLRLTGVSPSVRNMLRITGLETLLLDASDNGRSGAA